jgi:hypothetical protein
MNEQIPDGKSMENDAALAFDDSVIRRVIVVALTDEDWRGRLSSTKSPLPSSSRLAHMAWYMEVGVV